MPSLSLAQRQSLIANGSSTVYMAAVSCSHSAARPRASLELRGRSHDGTLTVRAPCGERALHTNSPIQAERVFAST